MAVDKMTDEHFETFREAAGEYVGLDREDCRLILRGLMEAGFTLTLPEPRYRVVVVGDHAYVVATDKESSLKAAQVATFNLDHHPDARCAAQAECDRLNRQETS